jgi:hypothetical protein
MKGVCMVENAATMDGPEVKFRFGRHVENLTGQQIFNVLP